jgi:hypothetical protein
MMGAHSQFVAGGRRLLLGVCLAVLALCVGSCRQAPVDTTEMRAALGAIAATCAASSGDVQVKRRQNAYWEPATLGTVFWPGDWVRTGRDAFMRVEFVPGGGLELAGDAVAIIEAPEAPGPGEAPEARVAVESGVVRGFIAPRGEHGGAEVLRIRDADGSEARLVAAEGDEPVEVRLARTESGTEIAVDTGRVTLVAAGASRPLEAGRGATLAQAGVQELRLLPSPGSLRPGTDTRLHLDPAAGVRLAWRAVAGATGYRLQIARDPGFREDARVVEAEEAAHLLEEAGAGRWVWRVASRDAEGRYGPYGPAQRLFLEEEAPRDHLVEPAAGARFGHSGEPPTIHFSWEAEPRTYRLVVATSPELWSDAVIDEHIEGGALAIDSLEPGEYHWGVFAADGDEAPLFLRPRPLTVRAVSVRTPRVIRDWGPGR